MDVEQFRRAYMSMEGMGNTPKRFFTRQAALAKNVFSIFSATKKDSAVRKEKAEIRKRVKEDIRENGISMKALKELAVNRPKMVEKNSSKTAKNIADASVNALKSWNELGSTGRVSDSTTAARRANSYGGQDLEVGAGFALKAVNAALKGISIATSMKQGLELGVIKGIGAAEIIGNAAREARSREPSWMPTREAQHER